MSAIVKVPTKTLSTWLIDAVAFTAGLGSILSGIYFLFLPTGGYQGGRNASYGITVLFERHTWEALHTWTSVLMIIAVAIHLALHWAWVRMSSRRVANHISGKRSLDASRVRFNIAINALVGVSFAICALSGIYFLFARTGGLQGGANLAWDPGFLFSRLTWDLIHTWSGVIMSAAVVVHFAIHWRWVTHVTARMVRSPKRQQVLQGTTARA